MKGLKTVIFHLAYGLPMVLLLLADFAGTSIDWKDLVGADKAKYIIPGIAAVSIVLRFYTTTPIGESTDFEDKR